jgi:hypothetical protein
MLRINVNIDEGYNSKELMKIALAAYENLNGTIIITVKNQKKLRTTVTKAEARGYVKTFFEVILGTVIDRVVDVVSARHLSPQSPYRLSRAVE